MGRWSIQVHSPYRASLVRIPAIIAALTEHIVVMLEGNDELILIVEMSWTIRTPSAAVYLREYEAAIDQLTERYGLTAVCLYNQNLLLDRQQKTISSPIPTLCHPLSSPPETVGRSSTIGSISSPPIAYPLTLCQMLTVP